MTLPLLLIEQTLALAGEIVGRRVRLGRNRGDRKPARGDDRDLARNYPAAPLCYAADFGELSRVA